MDENFKIKSNSYRQEKSIRLSRYSKKRLVFWLFCSVPVLIYSMFMLYPVFDMVRVSFFSWNSLVRPMTFIGLDNYIRMFSDERFYIALKNTVFFIIVSMGGALPVGFVLGFFLSNRLKGHSIFRTIFFSPGMLSVAALSMIFAAIYLPDGIINYFLRLIGLEAFTRTWLANSQTALASLLVVEFWGSIGWYAVLFFAFLSNIPREIYEAAELDGAGYWSKMWRIAFPMSFNFYGVMMILYFTWLLLGHAQIILILTKGGPEFSTLTLGFYLYSVAFEMRYFGYSQAIGVFTFIVGAIVMLLIRKITNQKY